MLTTRDKNDILHVGYIDIRHRKRIVRDAIVRWNNEVRLDLRDVASELVLGLETMKVNLTSAWSNRSL